jgi:hypothetical protein
LQKRDKPQLIVRGTMTKQTRHTLKNNYFGEFINDPFLRGFNISQFSNSLVISEIFNFVQKLEVVNLQ